MLRLRNHGTSPTGTYEMFSLDGHGALVVSPSLGQPTSSPGYITPFAPVGIGPSGNWEFFNIDNNGGFGYESG